MGLYKRGKVYWYKFEFLGKLHRGTTRLRNERQAERYIAKLKTDLAMGIVGLVALKPGPRFEDYVDDTFREFVRTRSAKHPETVRYYMEKLDRLLAYKPLADRRIHLIDEKLIEEYVQHRRKTNAPGSVNHELATLKRALRVAWKVHKLISGVPDIKMLPGGVERDFVLTYAQEKAYLAAAEDTLRDFAMLSLDTGVRAGEGVGLKWEDIRIEAHGSRLGYLHVREGGRKKRERFLPLTARVKAMFERRKRFVGEETYVFPGRSKGSHILVTSLDHQHKRARDAATVKIEDENGGSSVEKLPKEFVVHSLRHTFATRLGESGADAFEIMKAMGHSSITMSQKYVHPTPDSMERAFERLEAMNQILRGDDEAGRKLGVGTIPGTGRKRRL